MNKMGAVALTNFPLCTAPTGPPGTGGGAHGSAAFCFRNLMNFS